MRLLIALSMLGLVGASPPPRAVPVAVELFTSQGCSSCPPADAFAEELAKRADLVVLTRPVTYWDRLGWKDTLAREENTRLQQRYALHNGDGSGVYTPQMMVQGRLGAIGSRRGEVSAHIDRARRDIAAAIAVRPGLIAIDGKGGPAEVRLLDVKSASTVRIGSGENGGRTVRYSNVVLAETLIGSWKGGAQSFAIPAKVSAGADRRAVIVQAANAGPILAAVWL